MDVQDACFFGQLIALPHSMPSYSVLRDHFSAIQVRFRLRHAQAGVTFIEH
jgi:hypothetical protein